MDNDFLNLLERTGVLPVISLPDAELAVPLADALTAGGITAAEITFRTPAAQRAIQLIAVDRPDVTVGAGTVLDAETVKRAEGAGARFVVSPGFSATVADACARLGLPYLPGAVSASEVQAAIEHGFEIVKFFPAELVGGIPMIRALSAPFGWTGLRFVPTGGIGPDNLAAYLAEPGVACVGGSWMVTRKLLETQDWAAVTELARQATETLQRARPGALAG